MAHWMIPMRMRFSSGTRYVSLRRVVARNACRQSSNSGSRMLHASAKSLAAIALATAWVCRATSQRQRLLEGKGRSAPA